MKNACENWNPAVLRNKTTTACSAVRRNALLVPLIFGFQSIIFEISSVFGVKNAKKAHSDPLDHLFGSALFLF